MTRKRKTAADELDRRVEAILSEPGSSEPATEPSRANAELSALLRVAAGLRHLPRRGFREELDLALRPQALQARDLREEVRQLSGFANRYLGSLDRATIAVTQFAGQAPWERHPDGDELILVLEGGGDITVLTEGGPRTSELRPGMLFVCPKGLWHRAHARPAMVALYVTPLGGGEHSWAEDPRTAGA